ncbi:MAG: hypothetical protein JWO70_5198, partial [Betaproteobacteria bacterium]|nr:hypothetical protein [Betaproteobacteria bacterium]
WAKDVATSQSATAITLSSEIVAAGYAIEKSLSLIPPPLSYFFIALIYAYAPHARKRAAAGS